MVEEFYQAVQNYYKNLNTPVEKTETPAVLESPKIVEKSKPQEPEEKILDEILSRPWTKIPKSNKEILIQQYIQKVFKYAKKNNSNWKKDYDDYIYHFVNKIMKDNMKNLKIEYADKKIKKIANLAINLDFTGGEMKELVKLI